MCICLRRTFYEVVVLKKIAIILALLLLFSSALPAFAVEKTGKDVPIIHIYGLGADILNTEGVSVYTVDLPAESIAAQFKALIPDFIDAWKLKPDDAWDFYYHSVRDIVVPCFGPFFLDQNGENSDGTRVDWGWDHGNLPDTKGENGYGFLDYEFHFDWRLDPFVNAGILNDYVQDVKKATGSDKVNICARCEGANVLLAYFSAFGYDDLHCAEFYASGGRGVDPVSALFSGKIQVDGDALMRYKDQNVDIEDDLTRELVDALVVFSDSSLLLDFAATSFDVFSLTFLYDRVVAPILLETYATLPGIWSMVDKDDYAVARRAIFKGHEQEYAGLLEKLDHYDKDVRQCADELVLKAVEAGVKVGVFTKYNNEQSIPISKHCNSLSDGMVNVTDASFGATTADYGKTLSEPYLQKAAETGADKYISPDKMIDASTCVLPDTTWFFWNLRHSFFPRFLFAYLQRFFDADGELTVFDDPSFPQYSLIRLNKEDNDFGTLTPMGETNAPTITVPPQPTLKTVNWKDTVFRLLKAVWQFFVRWFKNR